MQRIQEDSLNRSLSAVPLLTPVAGLHPCSPRLRMQTGQPPAHHTVHLSFWFLLSLFGFFIGLGFLFLTGFLSSLKAERIFYPLFPQPPLSVEYTRMPDKHLQEARHRGTHQ